MKKLTVTPTKEEQRFGWVYWVFQLLPLQLLIRSVLAFIPVESSLGVINFIFFVVNFIATTVGLRSLLISCGKISLEDPMRTIISALKGFGLYWLMRIAVQLLIGFVSPGFTNENDANIQQMSAGIYPLMMVGVVFLVPVAEELLFRGVMFAGLHNKNRWLAYCVSTLLFASVHVIGYIGVYTPINMLLALLQYIPSGIAFAYAYEKADSIWASILAHMFNNLIAMFAMLSMG